MKKQNSKKILFEDYLERQKQFETDIRRPAEKKSRGNGFIKFITGVFSVIVAAIMVVLAVTGAIALYYPETRMQVWEHVLQIVR